MTQLSEKFEEWSRKVVTSTDQLINQKNDIHKELKNMVNKEDLKGMANKEDLKVMASKGDLVKTTNDMASKNDL